jgi:hypothetical protein
MSGDPAQQSSFDPLREAAHSRIKIVERVDGGKEFILPALRNFQEKFSFSIIWLVFAACFVGLLLVNVRFVNELPALLRFLVANHAYFFLGILGLIELVLTIACLDMWLRSSRVIALPGELRVTTHWLLFKRTVSISAANIIEIRADNNASVGTDLYFDIVVLAVGNKKGWLATYFPARKKPNSSFSENDLKVFNSGGKKIAVATGIIGQSEADWMIGQLRSAL